MQPDQQTPQLVVPLAEPVAVPAVNNVPAPAAMPSIKPKKPAADLTSKIKGCATQFWLLVTIVMLVALVGLGSYTLMLLTNGGVKVTFEAPARSTSTASATASETTSVDTNTVVTKHDIYFYLPVSPDELAAAELGGVNYPAGSISLGDHEFVVPYLYKQRLSTATPVSEALNGLQDQTLSTYKNGSITLVNPFTSDFAKDWRLKTEVVAGVQVINVEVDQLSGVSLTDVKLAKGMLQYTVERYTQNYELQLNGSKTDYAAWGEELISN